MQNNDQYAADYSKKVIQTKAMSCTKTGS